MPSLLSGSYIQYISVWLSNYSHSCFFLNVKRGQGNVAVGRDGVTLIVYALSDSLPGGRGKLPASGNGVFVSHPPAGPIHVPLTQEWTTRVGDRQRFALVSSLAICQVRSCGHGASRRAEAEMDPQSGCFTALWHLRHRIRGLIYREHVQEI